MIHVALHTLLCLRANMLLFWSTSTT